MTIIPETVTITRRGDGNYDLVAMVDIGTGSAEVTAILKSATLEVVVRYSERQDFFGHGWTETIPAKVLSYDLTIASPMAKDDTGIFFRQRVISGECK